MNNQEKIHVLSRAVIIDQDKILLCKTLDLEVSFYFLPGGHIKHGESAKSSLLRELEEETGHRCQIKRFLGCLEYSFIPGHSSICHDHEYSFIFEACCRELKVGKKISCPEQHIELVWMPLEKLDSIDFRAEPLRDVIAKWFKKDGEDQFISEMK